jgi:hypothetical protein
MKNASLILAATALLLASCASKDGGGKPAPQVSKAPGKKASSGPSGGPDHKPKVDFWQNGGGACCAYHAQLYQAQNLAGSKPKKS